METYQKLNASGKGFSFENGYSNEALATFPRYNVLNAILTEIERYLPTDFLSYEEAKQFFVLAVKEAQSNFTKPPNGEIKTRVMNEERELLCEYISQLSDKDLSIIEPLYYRHVLSETERNEIRAKLKTIWNVDGYWYPLTTWKIDNAEAFQDSYFEKEFGYEILKDILRNHNVTKIWELREDGIDYEIELSIFEPYYNGSEGFWCDSNYDWLIYASHESSITFAGTILDDIQNNWTNWQKRIWTSPFFD
jgi:hypothetical protein